MTDVQAAEMLNLLQQQLQVQQDTLSALNRLVDWAYGDHGLVVLGAAVALVFAGAFYIGRSVWRV